MMQNTKRQILKFLFSGRAMLHFCKKQFFAEMIIFSALLFCLCFIILHTSAMDTPPKDFDANSYITMALKPFSELSDIPGHHHQRILMPTLVWIGSAVLNIPTQYGLTFSHNSDSCYLAFHSSFSSEKSFIQQHELPHSPSL